MARLTTWRWAIIVAMTIALAAVAMRPGPQLERRRAWEPYGSDSQYRLSARMSDLRRQMIRVRVADSLERTLRLSRMTRDTFIVDARTDTALARALREMIRGQAAEVGPRQLPLLGVNVITPLPGAPRRAIAMDDFLLGDSTSAACIMMRISLPAWPSGDLEHFDSKAASRRASRMDAMGICGLIARYGRPSAAVQNFLATSHFSWARQGPHVRPYRFRHRVLVGDNAARIRVYGTFRGDLFGWSSTVTSFTGTERVLMFRCADHETSACDAVVRNRVAHAGLMRDSLPHGTGNRYETGSDGYESRLASHLTAKLAQSMGDSAFQRLWRDPRPLPVSYESITGRPFTSWLETYLAAGYGPIRRGPSVQARDFWLLLLLLLGTVSASAVFARTWRPT